MRRSALLLASLVILLGVAGAVVALTARQSDPQFVLDQQSLSPVSASQLSQLLAGSRDPRPGRRQARALSARCVPGQPGGLRNPWSCTVRYASLPKVAYRVDVAADGSIQGRSVDHALTLSGCCVRTGAGP
jgi:hypothetical protein